MLKKIALYLQRTKHWGIIFHKTNIDDTLPPLDFKFINPDNTLPTFPKNSHSSELTGYIDAAYGTDLKTRRSITGYSFTMCGGCISYCCKTQTITATSSTEAKLFAAVTAAKHAKYL